MARIALLFGLVGLLVLPSCAGKKTVPEDWDSIPAHCDRLGTNNCTPLPQDLPLGKRVEAGLRQVGDTRIQYYELIQEKPRALIIFIHGALGHASDFRKQFSRPVPNVNLLTFDRPGFVRSEAPEEPPSLAYQARAVRAFFRDAGDLPIVLVGHSYGGAIALRAALDSPRQVKGLVLTGAILDPGQAGAYWAQYLVNLPPLAAVLPRAYRNTNREILLLQKDLEKVRAELPRLAIPVEAIHGGKDPIVPPSNLFFLDRQLRQAHREGLLELKLWTEYGHLIPDRNPRALNEAIARELERMERP